MAFPSVAGTPVGTADTSSTSFTVALPSGIVAGELLFIFMAGDGIGLVTQSSGPTFTQIDTAVNGIAVQGECWARLATGGEGNPVFSNVNSQDVACVAIRVTAHGVTDVATDITKGTAATGADAAPNPPNCNPGSVKDFLWLEYFAADDDDDTATYESANYTQVLQQQSASSTSSCLVAVASRQLAASSENPGVMAMAASEEWVAQTIAIRPITQSVHTTDALKKATTDKTHTTDSLLKATASKTHTTDSLLKVTGERAHSTDTLLKATASKTHSTDALMKATAEKAHTTDSFLATGAAPVDKTHATDALLKATPEKAHSTDALLKAAKAQAHTTDALLKATADKIHATDALLKATAEKAHSTSSYLAFDRTHSTDSLLKAATIKTHSTDSFLSAGGIDRSHSTDSFLSSWTLTPIAYENGDRVKQWELLAAGNGDETYTFTHDLPLAPKTAFVMPLGTSEAFVSAFKAARPTVESVDATSVKIRKSTASGSGGVRFQVCVVPTLPA